VAYDGLASPWGGLSGRLRRLRRAVPCRCRAVATGGVMAAIPMLGTLRQDLTNTGATIGNLAKRFGELLASQGSAGPRLDHGRQPGRDQGERSPRARGICRRRPVGCDSRRCAVPVRSRSGRPGHGARPSPGGSRAPLSHHSSAVTCGRAGMAVERGTVARAYTVPDNVRRSDREGRLQGDMPGTRGSGGEPPGGGCVPPGGVAGPAPADRHVPVHRIRPSRCTGSAGRTARGFVHPPARVGRTPPPYRRRRPTGDPACGRHRRTGPRRRRAR